MNAPIPVVRLIIINAYNKVLILKRANSEYGNGDWCLPGGKIEYGDTIELTVEKELAEETALKCLSKRFLFYQDSLPITQGKMQCINFYFECETEGDIVLNSESSDFTWISKDEIVNYEIVFQNDRGLVRYFGE